MQHEHAAHLCALDRDSIGNVDVVVTAYDAAPVGGSFAAAHQLGLGTISNVTVVANATNSLNLVVGGTVASVVVSPASQSVSGTVSASYPLTFTAYDAQSEVIIAGTNTVTNGDGNSETDTFSNPIVFSVSEAGGSGHTLLSLNGGAHATSVTSSASGDTITVYYDGAASAGYSATIAAAASGASGSSDALAFTFGGAMLYVVSRNTSVVSAFPVNGPYGNVAPTSTVGGSNSGLTEPVGSTVDSGGNVYAVDDGSSQVAVWTSGTTGNVAPSRTFSPTIALGSEGLTSDTAGNIYESSYTTGVIAVFAPGASGSVAPTKTISGGLTTLSEPVGMFVDASGNLWVADRTAPAIDEFAANASGNVAPMLRITGGSTLLAHPTGVALDSTGRIIVADQGASCCSSGYVLVFASGSSGNVAPSAQIVGAATGLLDPASVAIDPSSGFWISDAFANSLSKFASAASGNAAPLAVFSGANTGLGDAQGLSIH